MVDTARAQLAVVEEDLTFDTAADYGLDYPAAYHFEYLINSHNGFIRFKHIHFTIETRPDPYEIFHACRLLEPLMRNKVVIVSLSGGASSDWIRSCRVWQCTKIEFVGKVTSEDGTNIIPQFLQGTPVKDTVPMWQTMQDNVLPELYRHYSGPLCDETLRLIKVFESHIRSYRFEEAQQCGRLIIQTGELLHARATSQTEGDEIAHVKFAPDPNEQLTKCLLVLWDGKGNGKAHD